MSISPLRYLSIPLPLLLTVSLFACGGGSSPAPQAVPVLPSPVAPAPVLTPPAVTPPALPSPEPAPVAPAVPVPVAPEPQGPLVPVSVPVGNDGATLAAQFVLKAQDDSCADVDNRLWVIDRTYVYKVVQGSSLGSCAGSADIGDTSGLFDLATQLPLCDFSAQIDKLVCKDAASQALSDEINSRQPALGLRAPTLVEPVNFLRRDGSTLVFGTKERSLTSRIGRPRMVVIRDGAALQTLAREHYLSATEFDFDRDMIIGIFAGNSPFCTAVTIDRVGVSAGKIVVEYEIFDSRASGVRYQETGAYDAAYDIESNQCQPIATPMHLIVVERNGAPVEFVQKQPVRLPFTILANTTRDRKLSKRNLVIKDAAAWTQTWNEAFANGGLLDAAPTVDFSKQMVVAVFPGGRPNLCYRARAIGVYRSLKGIVVSTTEVVRGPEELCHATLGSPAILMAIDRSDEPVEFISHVEASR